MATEIQGETMKIYRSTRKKKERHNSSTVLIYQNHHKYKWIVLTSQKTQSGWMG